MRRYLLVLDMDLLALDKELDQEPTNYLVARQEQERSEVVVLSLVVTRQAKLSSLELLLGAATSRGTQVPAKFPIAPQPGHDGLISNQDLVKAVGAKTCSRDYDDVILADGRQGSTRLARPASRPDSSTAATAEAPEPGRLEPLIKRAACRDGASGPVPPPGSVDPGRTTTGLAP